MMENTTKTQLERIAMLVGGGLVILVLLLDHVNTLAGTAQIPGEGSPLVSLAIRQWLMLAGLVVWTAYAAVAVAIGPDDAASV